jgi:hypothetical protein
MSTSAVELVAVKETYNYTVIKIGYQNRSVLEGRVLQKHEK